MHLTKIWQKMSQSWGISRALELSLVMQPHNYQNPYGTPTGVCTSKAIQSKAWKKLKARVRKKIAIFRFITMEFEPAFLLVSQIWAISGVFK